MKDKRDEYLAYVPGQVLGVVVGSSVEGSCVEGGGVVVDKVVRVGLGLGLYNW